MQSSIKTAILQVLGQRASGGYTIIELEEILMALPMDVNIQKSKLKEVLQQLKEEGYISIKYLDNESCCLTLLQMGREQAMRVIEMQNDGQHNKVLVVEKQESNLEERTKKSNLKNMALQFTASFSGGFLAGLITLIVVLCSR